MLHALSSLVLLSLQLASTRSATAVRCSLGPVMFRDADVIVVLGKAAEASDSTPLGWIEQVRYVRLEGGNPTALHGIVAAAPDSMIWIRPWSYDPACRRTHWNVGQRWLPRDTLGVIKLRLAPKNEWHQGRPTFDAFGAPHEPFPARDHGYDKGPDHAALTASDYFDFLMALPTYAPGQIAAMPPSLRRWLDDHPGLRGRYPVAETLRSWTRRP